MTITWARWLSLAVWAAVAASAVYWGLRLFASGPSVPPQAVAVAAATGLRGDPQRLLGGAAEAEAAPLVPPPAAASRFELLGVVAPRAPAAAGEGLALIAVDGKPARAFRVGAALDGDLVVQRVHPRGVEIGAAGAAPSFALNTPPLAAAASANPTMPRPLPRALPPRPPTMPVPVPLPAAEPVVEGDAVPDEPQAPEDGEPVADEVLRPNVPGPLTR